MDARVVHVPKIYATLKKRYSVLELRRLGFRSDGSRMVKLGGCRVELATASSMDGNSWRVTPMVKNWR